MRCILVSSFCLACLALLPGCLGEFAANQARRQAARSADYYIRTYAEPELAGASADDPAAQEQTRRAVREARNDMADVIVRSGNDSQQYRVGVNERGYLTNER